jgi:hypothetical protein
MQCHKKRLKKSFDFERVRTIFATDERITYTYSIQNTSNHETREKVE